jgi:DNA-binding MarR family transcriptional regulator
MLTQQLRELEKDGLINRIVYQVVSPKTEYSLTDFGRTLTPILDETLIVKIVVTKSLHKFIVTSEPFAADCIMLRDNPSMDTLLLLFTDCLEA